MFLFPGLPGLLSLLFSRGFIEEVCHDGEYLAGRERKIIGDAVTRENWRLTHATTLTEFGWQLERT